MRRVLFDVPGPSLLISLVLGLLVAAGVVVWLLWLRRRQTYTIDHLYTGAALVGMAAVLLLVFHRMGHLSVHAYGAMLMCGFIAGTITAVRLGLRRGVSADRVVDLGLFILVGAIIGARVGYVLQNPGEPFLNMAEVLQNGIGGLSFHGGLIGGLLTGSTYILFIAKLSYWRVADTLAPGIAIGYAVTRIGCFLNGCCYGIVAHGVPWAMIFPNLRDGDLRHPTQLYASAMGLVMWGLLLLLARGRSLDRAGRLFMTFLVLEGIERFVMEIYRQPDPSFHGGLTAAQLVSVLLFLGGIAGWFLLPRRPAVELPAPQPAAKSVARTS